MAILKRRDQDTSITFEMRRRPLNAFPDIPDEFDQDLMQSRNEGTLSRRVSSLFVENLKMYIYSIWILVKIWICLNFRTFLFAPLKIQECFNS